MNRAHHPMPDMETERKIAAHIHAACKSKPVRVIRHSHDLGRYLSNVRPSAPPVRVSPDIQHAADQVRALAGEGEITTPDITRLGRDKEGKKLTLGAWSHRLRRAEAAGLVESRHDYTPADRGRGGRRDVLKWRAK